jgi:hypothetical protein
MQLGRVAFVSAVVMLAAVSAARAQGTPQQVYAIVVDSDGFPVRGLSAEDFSLRDGSVRQAVLGVEPATNPVSLAVVIRGFGSQDVVELRRALAAMNEMTRRGPTGSRIGVVETSAALPRWIDASAPIPDATLNALVTASARPLVDVVGAACVALRGSATDRRAIVLLVKRSSADGFAESRAITDNLFTDGTALWTVEVGDAPATTPAPPRGEARLDDALTDATKFSGSLRERVPDMASLAPTAARVANLVLAQYVVSYLWPNPMLGTFSIATRHDRGDVLVPAWAR